MVIQELARAGLDEKHLSGPEDQQGSCSYSFDFAGQGQELNYVVMSTWLHGVTVNIWDYKRDPREHASPAYEPKPAGTAQ